MYATDNLEKSTFDKRIEDEQNMHRNYRIKILI